MVIIKQNITHVFYTNQQYCYNTVTCGMKKSNIFLDHSRCILVCRLRIYTHFTVLVELIVPVDIKVVEDSKTAVVDSSSSLVSFNCSLVDY
jgi:hypothetical protein